jgi:hypothetical protein
MTRCSSSGFAVSGILYLLTLVGVLSGVLFSSYSQIIQSGQRVSQNLAAKTEMNNAATTLAAAAVLSSDSLTLCPPRSSHGDSTCSSASVKMTLFADMTDTSKLPVGYASAGSSGSPLEVGVFMAGSGIKLLDPWGHTYVYCRWENLRSSPSSPALAILSAGSTGVLSTKCGDTAPSGGNLLYRLDVGSAIQRAALWAATATTVQYGATGSQVTVGSDGSVTAQSLTVAGTATISGAVIGSSFYNPQSSSNNSTAFGLNAGGLTYWNNTAFGFDALQFNTTGFNNAAFGTWALWSNTSGDSNAAFGQGALYANTTGQYNAAFGEVALTANTTGSSNSAFGQAVLIANLTGYGNSGFGTRSLQTNTTGYGNNAYGWQSLYSNTTGNENAGFGDSSLYHLTTGSYNAALGSGSGYAITTGGSNTCLGTGTCSNVLATGSGNILIGNYAYQADTPTANTSNFLNIGNLIYGLLSSGSVGIGTTAPAAKLDVNGGIKVGSDSASCNTTRAGEIKFSGSKFYGCNGTAWLAFTATGS